VSLTMNETIVCSTTQTVQTLRVLYCIS